MPAEGVGFTITVTLLEAFPPTASVAVTVAVNDPLTLYVWLVEQPVPLLPSPKVQVHVNAPVPPVGLAVRLTEMPTSVGFGLAAGAATLGAALTITE